MAQVLIGVRFSLVAQVPIGVRLSLVIFFFQDCEKLWLTNGKIEG